MSAEEKKSSKKLTYLALSGLILLWLVVLYKLFFG